MSSISIRGLTKRFGAATKVTAVDHLDLDVDPGEFVILLGPSGCGKTTTLRCLAGLEAADEGTIVLGDRVVFDAKHHLNLPANKREIGMVFQTYALWPHLTVRKNIEYPLRARRIRVGARDAVEEAARLVECEHLLDRYPAQLSGGQQQRVALARAIVARPSVLLLDEPLSNLDAQLRDQVRGEIHELHERIRFTGVYVTHDHREAFALGDRLVIMRNGAIEQVGTPADIFEEPTTEYVSEFVGMANRVVFRYEDRQWRHGDRGVDLGARLDPKLEEVVARGRPEDCRIISTEPEASPGTVALPATVVDSQFAGRQIEISVTTGTTRLICREAAGERSSWVRAISRGDEVWVILDLAQFRFFDREQAISSEFGEMIQAMRAS
jgi:iron(III) transport system ATP-binding protein